MEQVIFTSSAILATLSVAGIIVTLIAIALDKV
jgi:hypothetical protein